MKRRLPPLNAIRAFEAAARLESISDAADELSVTPTAISHQIRHLENLLDLKLFERSGRSITLTDQGARMLPDITRGMDSLAAAFAETYGNLDTNTVTISTTREFARFWLQPRLGDFYDTFPQLTLNIFASENAVDMSGSEIDVAVRYGGKPSEGSDEIELYQEYYVAAVSRELLIPNRAARTEFLIKKRLIDVRWENSSLTAPSWKAWFDAAGIKDFDNFRRMSFDAYNLAFDALRRGHGAALLSRTIVRSAEFRDEFVEMEGPQLPGYFYRVLRSPQGMRKRAVRQFVEWLEEEASRSPISDHK
ncbi:LysR substrate-binding domain-containing protein [Ruegeria atlantica]|uniref:LysR substrate-binding domain-containing protein n=1 Tax=Ruegeria atlantica TaxID=81569 RepID=UPI00147F0A51|nr:LysR substrate-binding domain-containing protein [Ruegeria atlantica]